MARRWNNEYGETVEYHLPAYEQRHHHLHRNGRMDVVGYSPVDGANQEAMTRQYGPYGELLASGTVAADGTASVVGGPIDPQFALSRRNMLSLGLTSKQYDPETKLYYFGYRWYSPELMRWTQIEPLGLDGPSLWQFTHGNPIGRIDPNGLDDGEIVIGKQYHHLLTQRNGEHFKNTCGIDVHKKDYGVLLPTKLHESIRVSWEADITKMIDELKLVGSTSPADVDKKLDDLINSDKWRLVYGEMLLPGDDYLTRSSLSPDAKELRCLPGKWIPGDDGPLRVGARRAIQILAGIALVGTFTDVFTIAEKVYAGDYDGPPNTSPLRIFQSSLCAVLANLS